jgi:hypothetical protein
MIGKFADQPPFVVRELGARCAPPRRLLALAHGGEPQSKDAPKLVPGIRMGGKKGVGAVD